MDLSNSVLLGDHYQLTMLHAYHNQSMEDTALRVVYTAVTCQAQFLDCRRP